jgi:hypothetical protein
MKTEYQLEFQDLAMTSGGPVATRRYDWTQTPDGRWQKTVQLQGAPPYVVTEECGVFAEQGWMTRRRQYLELDVAIDGDGLATVTLPAGVDEENLYTVMIEVTN